MTVNYMDGSEMSDSLEEKDTLNAKTETGKPHLRLVHSDGGPPHNNSPWLANLAQGTVFLARLKGKQNFATNLIPYEVKFKFKKATLLRVSHPDEREWYSYEDTAMFSAMWELFEVIYPLVEQENEDQSNWSNRPSDVEHPDHVET